LTIEERLLSVRKHVGITQAQFAKKFGLSSRAYASYELGERELPSSFAIKLHDELSVSPTWLLTGKGPRSSEIRDQNLLSALEITDAFITKNKLKLKPNEAAELVHMLWELFNEGISPDSPTVKRILEKSL